MITWFGGSAAPSDEFHKVVIFVKFKLLNTLTPFLINCFSESKACVLLIMSLTLFNTISLVNLPVLYILIINSLLRTVGAGGSC